MKVRGRVVDGPKKVLLVLPRDDGDIPFQFVAVVDDSEFEKIIPEPEPPVTFNVKAQQNIKNYGDPGYKAKHLARIKLKNAWIFLKSIESSDIEWDTVKMDDPSTWENWQSDLKASGFSINEVNTIFDHFALANMVNEKMLDDARMRFLASGEKVPSPVPSSQGTEQQPTPSGVPANDLVSAPQG